MATIEYQGFMHTHQPKVRAKEKREVRGRVDNNHISLKNRQIARIRLGKRWLYNAHSLLKLAIWYFITVLYFCTTDLSLTVPTKTWIDGLPVFVLAWRYFARRINRSNILSVCIIYYNCNQKLQVPSTAWAVYSRKRLYKPVFQIRPEHLNFSTVPEHMF